MAILSNNSIGGFSGKTGGMVGYQLNGRTIIRSIGSRSKKVSEKELNNRAKFALTQQWLRPLLPFLRIGFKNYAPTFQGFVAAKSYVSKHALKQKEDGSYFIDPALVMISHGHLPLPDHLKMESNGSNVVVTWDDLPYTSIAQDVMMVAYDPLSRSIWGDTTLSKRHLKNAELTIPKRSREHEYHVYIAFIAYDHSAQSNSYYLGSVTV